MPDTVVGRVYVDDPDDWDLPDKTFSWLAGQEYRHFQLDRETGNITMRYGTPNGTYPLQFKVCGRCLMHGLPANVPQNQSFVRGILHVPLDTLRSVGVV